MFIEELRQAMRRLKKAPGFASAAILSLALGIGGNVAIFSLMNAVLLKPLRYAEPERLVLIRQIPPKTTGGPALLPVRPGYLMRWRNELRSFESLGAAVPRHKTLTGSGQPERVGTLLITADFLDVLGARPQLGRWLRRAEEDRDAANVVILSDSLWRRRFSADPGIIGRTVLVDGAPHEVVGVAPGGMSIYRGEVRLPISLPENIDLFLPLRLSPGELDPTRSGSLYWALAIGRLKRGVTAEQAQAEIELSMAALSRINRDRFELHARVDGLQRALVGDNRKGLLVLMGSVGFVLLIVSVNLSNLMMVRAEGRRNELGIRAALGAGRRRLIESSVAESVLISVCGTAFGLLLGSWLIDAVIAASPARLPGLDTVGLDRYVLAFSAGLSVLTALLFGFLPAWRTTRVSPLESFQAAGQRHTIGPRGSRAGAMLVAAEVALSTLLLIGAGLLLASFQRVMNVGRGFESEHVFAVDLALPVTKYLTSEQRISAFRRIDAAVSSLPGVRAAGYLVGIPLERPGYIMPAIRAGSENLAFSSLPVSTFIHASSGTFSALGIQLRKGRLFVEGEQGLVAVLSETAAQRVFGVEDPIGKRFRQWVDSTKDHWFTVVGVVGDARWSALDRPPDSLIYTPYWQMGWQVAGDQYSLVLRTAMDPKAIRSAVSERVWSVDPDLPVNQQVALTQILADSVAQRRFQAVMVTIFAAVAILLAAIGIYGVVTYSAAQRRAEVGVRLALGASSGSIRSLLVRDGMKPVLAGIGLGILAGGPAARVIQSMLFEVRPLDPVVFMLAPLFLCSVALLACYLPAHRIAGVDPLIVLRYE
jgi:predicted permease